MASIDKFLAEEQDPEAVGKLMGKVNSLLAVGEVIDYVAVQKKPLFNAFPDCVAVSQQRIIFCRLKNFGLNMEFNACLWKDVVAMDLLESRQGVSITIKTAKVTEIMGYLPQAQARKLYEFGQAIGAPEIRYWRHQEPATTRPVLPGSEPSSGASGPATKVSHLARMLDNKLINQEEYEKRLVAFFARS